jgi:dihydroxyacetone kinase-like protein
MDNALKKRLLEAVAGRIIAHSEELTALDQAIGDGDHGLNMKRGFEAVLAKADELAGKPMGEALKALGMELVMKVGGASGPLYGSLFMGMGKVMAGEPGDRAALLAALEAGIADVEKRGKATTGQKTMLDVLVPVAGAIRSGADIAGVRKAALEAAQATVPMLATRGRASFLKERSVGHMDPGARSSELIISAVCDVLEARA